MINTDLLNPLRWKRSFLTGILVTVLVLWFGFLDNYSLLTRYQLGAQKTELEREIKRLKQETEVLEVRIEALRNDPSYLEKIAREEYGMRRAGETIYQIREK